MLRLPGSPNEEIVGSFSCNKAKRFVRGAPYSQWSSSTTEGGEAARNLCRNHWTAAQKPHGWWFQYYENGHFNCAKFNQAVTQAPSTWENTHGRPEEVCVPASAGHTHTCMHLCPCHGAALTYVPIMPYPTPAMGSSLKSKR